MTSSKWPNGCRTAAIVSVLLEVWADGKWPSYFPRTTALKPGVADVAAKQWSDFGVREGVYRLLSLLARHKLRATFFTSAIIAERDPELLRTIAREGHFIAAHGYSQDQFLLEMTVDQQSKTIVRCLDDIEKACGRRPTGWVSSVYSWTADTVALLAGAGLRWHADALDASLPYRQHVGGGTIIALPWCDFVDNRVLRGNPADFAHAYERLHSYLKTSGELGLLQVGIHCHFGGRPVMSASIDRIFSALGADRETWLATHDDIALWFDAERIDRISHEDQFVKG